jgi:hypothetical protein
VTAHGKCQGTPFIEFDCDASMDGLEFHRLLAASGTKIPLASADAFITTLHLAMQAAHAATARRRSGPMCLGRLTGANLLFSKTGQFYLLGFGRNFPVEGVSGRPDCHVTAFQAPEVAVGGKPTPGGDYVALLLFSRSLLPMVEVGPVLSRVLRGEEQDIDPELIECLRFADQHVIGAPVWLRRSIEEAEHVADRIRALCNIRPDPQGFARCVRAVMSERAATEALPCNHRSLVLGIQTSWIAGPDGERYPLGQAHRGIVTALAELHRNAPGAVLTMQQLLEAGWPGERIIPEAGANRVYVALAQLRRLGMRDILERRGGGYRLALTTSLRMAM